MSPTAWRSSSSPTNGPLGVQVLQAPWDEEFKIPTSPDIPEGSEASSKTQPAAGQMSVRWPGVQAEGMEWQNAASSQA